MNAPARADPAHSTGGTRERLGSLAWERVQPRFALTLTEFVERTAERLESIARELGTPADPERLWLDDLYLAMAAADGEAEAWREMEQRFFGFIRQFTRRFGLSSEDAAEVADGVIGDLWSRGAIDRFQGRSLLKTWLGSLVTHAALSARDRQRRRPMAVSEEGLAGGPDPRPDASAGFDRTAAEATIGGVLTAAVARLDARERLLLLLHYEQGLTLDRIGAIERRSKATLSRALKAARERLRTDIEERLGRRHDTNWHELSADLDLAQLDLDLPSLLSARDSDKGTD